MENRIGPVEATTKTKQDVRAAEEIDRIYRESGESDYLKLINFPRFVPRQALSKFLCRYEIFKKVLNIQGSIVECGVLSGGSLFSFAQFSAILEPVNHQRKIIGFDTFEGFPRLHQHDEKGTSSNLEVGGYSGAQYEDLLKSVQAFDDNRFLSHIPKIELIKGDASRTIPKYVEQNPHLVVSLLYLDIDLYEPTKCALKYFKSRMPKGAVIIFDELNCDTFPGETIAVQEELGLNSLKIERFAFDTNISYTIL